MPDSNATAAAAAASAAAPPASQPAESVPKPEMAGPLDPAVVEQAVAAIVGGGTTAAGEYTLTVAVTPQEELTASVTSPQMSLDEAMLHAVQHHPRLRAMRHEVQVARAKLVAAGVLTNPKLVLDYDTEVNQDEGSEVSGRMMFTIPTADKLRLGKSVACAEIARAQYAAQRETRVVLQEVGEAGVDVLYYQELLSLKAQESEQAAKYAAVQRGRFEAQQITGADAIRAEIAAKELELHRLETATQFDAARLRLSKAIGTLTPLSGLRGSLAVEALPTVPTTKLLEVAERNAPDINEARATLAVSQRQLALERANAVPDLEIGPRTRNVAGVPEGRNPSLGGRIAVDLPLFDRNQGAICESAAQTDVDQALLEDVALTTLGDAASAYERLRSLQRRLQFFDSQFLPLAEQTQATIRESEATGAMAPNQIATLVREVVKIRLTHLELRYRYATLYRQLENLLGCRLAELQAVSP